MAANDLATTAGQQAHDTAVAAAYADANRAAAHYASERKYVTSILLRLTPAKARTLDHQALLDALADAATTAVAPTRYTECADRLTAAREQADATEAAFEALEEQYTGWPRFFLVSGGHIHSSMNCSTCNHNGKATQFGWLPELSGLDEAAAVEAQGAYLCTTCFPSAPVEWTNGREVEAAANAAASCSGTGTTDWEPGTTRFGYAAGNGGICSHCGARVSATSGRRIRKHKPAAK